MTNPAATDVRAGYVRRALITGTAVGAIVMACFFGVGAALNSGGSDLGPLQSAVFGALLGVAAGGAGGLVAGGLVALVVGATRSVDARLSAVCAGAAAAAAPLLVLLAVLGSRDGMIAISRPPFVALTVTAGVIAAGVTPYVRTGRRRDRRTQVRAMDHDRP
jgi:hypothetical protein